MVARPIPSEKRVLMHRTSARRIAPLLGVVLAALALGACGDDEKSSGTDRLRYLVRDDRGAARRGDRAHLNVTQDDVPTADGHKMWANVRHRSRLCGRRFDADLDRGRRTSLAGTLTN